MKKQLWGLLWALFAGPALACSITAAGNCGGSECDKGYTCTKTDDVTCKCVKDKPKAKKKHKKHDSAAASSSASAVAPAGK